ncbi:3-phosphoshikimate 1-carboxyvinyltransferase [Vulcanisaeta moutnovskia 768-28]|uniref:3-phosphoshikimate 1-carboxyvinyltransferase n=1 Tax=Vulcanisaeta moutnovskia (strain 768-28) TaxID=985053 RepID=F0QT41_VULM7|nr:3-phosphoshikimate 1-carboxyvinyltransferase [Vulcanisaeta moutnovskia]ADY01630.1 3-phosphoshikimate 1-carboxyvinyltransferase [Vulcanisaeta moutnovskia 768-28]
MSKLIINGFRAREGVVEAPPSKALTLRYILASALSRTWVLLRKLNWGDDTWSMIRGIKPISEVEVKNDSVRIRREVTLERFRVIDTGESGFTLRTLTGVYSGIDGTTLLVPRGSLIGRPMDELLNALKNLNAKVDRLGSVIRVIGSKLVGGYVTISGSISSQYVSALLYLAPLTEGGIEISIKPPVKSRPYIDATINVLKDFNINVEGNNDMIYVSGSQEFKAVNEEFVIPGDYSLAAYYTTLSVLTGVDIRITNLHRDRAIESEYAFIRYAREVGVEIEEKEGSVIVKGSSVGDLKPLNIDLSDSPDIVMPLALLLARAHGKSRIVGINHLVYKESNRLRGVASVLKCLGAGVNIDEVNGIIEIEGVHEMRGGCEIDAVNDHRIVMMSVIGALSAKEPITIINWEGISKSWPAFIWDLEKLGAEMRIINASP